MLMQTISLHDQVYNFYNRAYRYMLHPSKLDITICWAYIEKIEDLP